MEKKGKKNLTRKQFTQILKLESNGPFEIPTYDKVLSMLNEMGYYPCITLISAFRKSIYHLYGVTSLECSFDV